MEHERMFHIVLASIAIPFLVVAPATYVYDFTQNGGEFFRVSFLGLVEYIFIDFTGLHLSRLEATMVGNFEEKPALTLLMIGKG